MKANRIVSRSKRRWALGFGLVLGFVMVTSLGCGPSKPKTYPINGTVTFRGQPLPKGVVMMRPQTGPAATAEIGPDGKYSLEIVAGTHAVQVVALNLSEEAKEDMAKLAAAQSLIPQKYNRFETSGLTVTIEPDQSESVDINLQ